MPRTMQDFEMSLETMYWQVDPVPDDVPSVRHEVVPVFVHVWPVFFKIDGTTTGVSAAGELTGTATVTAATDIGSLVGLSANSSVVMPADIAQWSDQVLPIPVDLPPPIGPDFGGVFGVALLLLDPGGLEKDALRAGRAALTNSLQAALDELITKLSASDQDIKDKIHDLVKEVSTAVNDAISGATSFWLKWLELWHDQPRYGNTFMYLSQDDLPVAEFEQQDFDPTADSGPALIDWPGLVEGQASPTVDGRIGLSGGVSRSRRSVGEGVIGHLGNVRAAAGYTSADSIQHAIAATGDHVVTELWWQGPAAATANELTRFDTEIVALAGYPSPDGFQHVIVATADGTVTELYWLGSGQVGQDTLSGFTSGILALAGYSDADGFQHVIVATADGDLTELWWQSGEVGRGNLSHLDSPVVDLAGFFAGGVHNVVSATQDGAITLLTWSGGSPATPQLLTQVEAQPWNHVVGVGAYQAAGESHVVLAMSNGTLRELHFPPIPQGDPLHTDLATLSGIQPNIGAYLDDADNAHAIVATADGNLHELWWSNPLIVIFNT